MSHEPCLYATTRYGCWCHCTCGQWRSRTYTTVTGAHIAFGTHLLDIGGQPRE
jgi:hypothetical protein